MISVTPEAKCLKTVTLGGAMVAFGVSGQRGRLFLSLLCTGRNDLLFWPWGCQVSQPWDWVIHSSAFSSHRWQVLPRERQGRVAVRSFRSEKPDSVSTYYVTLGELLSLAEPRFLYQDSVDNHSRQGFHWPLQAFYKSVKHDHQGLEHEEVNLWNAWK